jgi:hypothetical protein
VGQRLTHDLGPLLLHDSRMVARSQLCKTRAKSRLWRSPERVSRNALVRRILPETTHLSRDNRLTMDLLAFNPQHRVLLCKLCGYAVAPTCLASISAPGIPARLYRGYKYTRCEYVLPEAKRAQRRARSTARSTDGSTVRWRRCLGVRARQE